MDQSIQDLKTSVDAYIVAVNEAIALAKANVAEEIAKAVAADDAGEAVDLKAIQNKVDAELSKLTAPPFEPSNQ